MLGWSGQFSPLRSTRFSAGLKCERPSFWEEEWLVECDPFLPRCMECRRGLAMRILSVGPSVRPSHAWIVTKP